MINLLNRQDIPEKEEASQFRPKFLPPLSTTKTKAPKDIRKRMIKSILEPLNSVRDRQEAHYQSDKGNFTDQDASEKEDALSARLSRRAYTNTIPDGTSFEFETRTHEKAKSKFYQPAIFDEDPLPSDDSEDSEDSPLETNVKKKPSSTKIQAKPLGQLMDKWDKMNKGIHKIMSLRVRKYKKGQGVLLKVGELKFARPSFMKLTCEDICSNYANK